MDPKSPVTKKYTNLEIIKFYKTKKNINKHQEKKEKANTNHTTRVNKALTTNQFDVRILETIIYSFFSGLKVMVYLLGL